MNRVDIKNYFFRKLNDIPEVRDKVRFGSEAKVMQEQDMIPSIDFFLCFRKNKKRC